MKKTMSETNLPNKEEFILQNKPKNNVWREGTWSEPKYKCPECGNNMRKNLTIMLTSYPPKYEYRCDNCNHIDYLDF